MTLLFDTLSSTLQTVSCSLLTLETSLYAVEMLPVSVWAPCRDRFTADVSHALSISSSSEMVHRPLPDLSNATSVLCGQFSVMVRRVDLRYMMVTPQILLRFIDGFDQWWHGIQQEIVTEGRVDALQMQLARSSGPVGSGGNTGSSNPSATALSSSGIINYTTVPMSSLPAVGGPVVLLLLSLIDGILVFLSVIDAHSLVPLPIVRSALRSARVALAALLQASFDAAAKESTDRAVLVYGISAKLVDLALSDPQALALAFSSSSSGGGGGPTFNQPSALPSSATVDARTEWIVEKALMLVPALSPMRQALAARFSRMDFKERELWTARLEECLPTEDVHGPTKHHSRRTHSHAQHQAPMQLQQQNGQILAVHPFLMKQWLGPDRTLLLHGGFSIGSFTQFYAASALASI
eukprot:ANDGO_06533.mRNA.1 hypothetical protein